MRREKNEEIGNIMDSFAKGMLQARKERRMTQKELADKSGIYQADVSKMERGLSNPSLSTIQRVADALGVDVQINFKMRKK